jgi:hypothetical protein
MVFPLTFDKRRKVDEAMKKWNAEGIIYKMLITQNNVIALGNFFGSKKKKQSLLMGTRSIPRR